MRWLARITLLLMAALTAACQFLQNEFWFLDRAPPAAAERAESEAAWSPGPCSR
jgi:hypothetical protein